jgi:hypothetical protein
MTTLQNLQPMKHLNLIHRICTKSTSASQMSGVESYETLKYTIAMVSAFNNYL